MSGMGAKQVFRGLRLAYMETREFGKFTLLESMGKGSVGTVYRATDSESGNIVAIKIFDPTAERPRPR